MQTINKIPSFSDITKYPVLVISLSYKNHEHKIHKKPTAIQSIKNKSLQPKFCKKNKKNAVSN